MLDLIHYLKSVGIHAVGTIRQNRSHGYPLISLKDLRKQEWASVDYPTDNNSGLVVVKWLDNSIVHFVSKCISVEQISMINQWDNKSKVVKAVPCPKIVSTCNKSKGSLDLAETLVALYRIDVKTHHWYINVFWHFVDVAKVNPWTWYKRHSKQLGGDYMIPALPG